MWKSVLISHFGGRNWSKVIEQSCAALQGKFRRKLEFGVEQRFETHLMASLCNIFNLQLVESEFTTSE